METRVIGDYCQICGDGVPLGNKCTFCKKSPFCDQCSERNDAHKRVCNECKEVNNLKCFSCGVLSSWECSACKKLKEKGLRDKVVSTCINDMNTLFKNPDTGSFFKCKNCSLVCRICVEKKGLIFTHYFCRFCNNELDKHYFN